MLVALRPPKRMVTHVDNVSVYSMPGGKRPVRGSVLLYRLAARIQGTLERQYHVHRINVRIPDPGQRYVHGNAQHQAQDHGGHVVRRHGRVVGCRHHVRENIPVHRTTVR